MPESGYITLSRKFFAHWLWEEDRDFSRAEAWLDMIRMATFRDETACIQGRCLNLRTGELVASVRYLNARWGWSKSKVERFLHTLETNRMIETRTETGITVVTLSNYGRYNGGRDTNRDSDEDTLGTVAGHSRDESKALKNGKNLNPIPEGGPADLFSNPDSKPQGKTKAKGWNPTVDQLTVGGWFNRKPATAWGEKEIRAWQGIQPLDPEDLKALAWFYTQSGCAFLRRDLLTLLNNWRGEVDRAINYDPEKERR